MHAVFDDQAQVVRFALIEAAVGEATVACCLLDRMEAALVLGDKGYPGGGVYAETTKTMTPPRTWQMA